MTTTFSNDFLFIDKYMMDGSFIFENKSTPSVYIHLYALYMRKAFIFLKQSIQFSHNQNRP